MFATQYNQNQKQETIQFVSAPISYFPVAVPAISLPTLIPLNVQAVESRTSVCIYNMATNTLEPCPFQLQEKDGMLLPLEGWSFVTIPGLSDLNSSRESSVVPTSFSRPISVESTPEPGFVEEAEPQRMAAGEEPAGEPGQRRKYPHGSKQVRIMEVFNNIRKKYTALGTWAADNELLRGTDTVRVHVKNYKGLNKIEDALDEIDACPNVVIHKIATPFSMKNKYQKKGFIVYLRLRSPLMVPCVQDIFARYVEFFKKCDVALPKENSTFIPSDPNGYRPTDPTFGDFFEARQRSESEDNGLCGQVSLDVLEDSKPLIDLTPRTMVPKHSWSSEGC